MRYIIIIWHQAGGRNNHKIYYAWSDENEVAHVFDSPLEAKTTWEESGMHENHAGMIVEVTTENVEWI
jgi:hypothetical protein